VVGSEANSQFPLPPLLATYPLGMNGFQRELKKIHGYIGDGSIHSHRSNRWAPLKTALLVDSRGEDRGLKLRSGVERTVHA